MSKIEINYEITEKFGDRLKRIKILMKEIDLQYKPSDFNLDTFCNKINKYATIIFAMKDNQDVGIAILYANDHKTKIAHMSFMGILSKYQSLAISRKLFQMGESYAREQNMNKIMGEVNIHNKAALYFLERTAGYSFVEDCLDPDYKKVVKDL